MIKVLKMNLEDKFAIVTGTSTRIGRVISIELGKYS